MKKKASNKKRPPVKIRVSHTRKPADMSDVQWQIILRQQIAEDENFNIQKISEAQFLLIIKWKISKQPLLTKLLYAVPITR